MTSESGYEPWPGAAFDGRATAPPLGPQIAPPRPTRGVVVASGIAIALALGLGVGYLAQPDLGAPDAAYKPMAPAPPGAQQGLIIQPGAAQAVTAPASVPRATGKLEVLPPDMVRAARQATLASAPAPVAATSAVRDVSDVTADPSPPASYLAAPQVPAQPPTHLAPPPPAQAYPTPYPRMAAADGPCAGPASRAAQIVCSDPDLSAADQALNRAYRRALRSGALPPEQLRADQRDWLAAREDAARRSPRALARIYDQRIDELNSLADDEPD